MLAFGPHPDDIEIGLAGTIAVHTAAGFSVGLCDLTRGELGSNGTPEERQAEAEAARVVLGAAWRTNLRWPDGGITGDELQVADVARLVRQSRPRAVAIPYWDDRHPDHRAASDAVTRGVFKSGLRRYVIGDAMEPWRPEWVCYYFINDSVPPSFAIDVSAHYEREARGAGLPLDAVHDGRARQRRDPAHVAALRAADREPRRAPRRTHRRRLR